MRPLTTHRPTLDTRWLTVHPVTALWWQQREQCRNCKHYMPAVVSIDAKHGDKLSAERCRASTFRGPGGRTGGYTTHYETCIDARGTAEQRGDGIPGLCGPAAVLYEPKE